MRQRLAAPLAVALAGRVGYAARGICTQVRRAFDITCAVRLEQVTAIHARDGAGKQRRLTGGAFRGTRRRRRRCRHRRSWRPNRTCRRSCRSSCRRADCGRRCSADRLASRRADQKCLVAFRTLHFFACRIVRHPHRGAARRIRAADQLRHFFPQLPVASCQLLATG